MQWSAVENQSHHQNESERNNTPPCNSVHDMYVRLPRTNHWRYLSICDGKLQFVVCTYRIDKDLYGHPNVLGLDFFSVGGEFLVGRCFVFSNSLDFLGEHWVVSESVGLVLSDPPVAIVDLDVVPSPPTRSRSP